MKKNRLRSGFTLIETVLVLGISAVMIVVLVNGYNSNTKVERFSGNIKELSANIKQRRVDAIAIKSDSCGNQFCRGVSMEARSAAGDTDYGEVNFYRLYGNDASRLSGGSQSTGLTGKAPLESIDLQPMGMRLVSIKHGSVSTSQATIAFLSPDGQAYTEPITIAVTSFNPNVSHYNQTASVTLEFVDIATGMTGSIKYNPVSNRTDIKI